MMWIRPHHPQLLTTWLPARHIFEAPTTATGVAGVGVLPNVGETNFSPQAET